MELQTIFVVSGLVCLSKMLRKSIMNIRSNSLNQFRLWWCLYLAFLCFSNLTFLHFLCHVSGHCAITTGYSACKRSSPLWANVSCLRTQSNRLWRAGASVCFYLLCGVCAFLHCVVRPRSKEYSACKMWSQTTDASLTPTIDFPSAYIYVPICTCKQADEKLDKHQALKKSD